MTPSIAEECFEPLDAETRDVFARVLQIARPDADSDIVRLRLELPGRFSGCGLLPHVDQAKGAYIGGVAAVFHRLKAKIPDLHPSEITGFVEAVQELELEFNEEGAEAVVPTVEDVISWVAPTTVVENDGDVETRARAPKKATVGRMIAELVHKKKLQRALQVPASGLQKKALLASSSRTAADFMFTRISIQTNHTHRHFVTHAKRYLGVPVTDDRCSIGDHDDEPMIPNGDHSGHAMGAVNRRHTYIKYLIGDFCTTVGRSRHFRWSVGYETAMLDLANLRENFAPTHRGQVCDFHLHNPEANKVLITDVVVSHPDFSLAKDPNLKREEAAQAKLEVYSKWDVAVYPLSFDTYGNYADVTWAFLKNVTDAMANNDGDIAGKLMRALRERIATAIVITEGRIIDEINRKNHIAKHRPGSA